MQGCWQGTGETHSNHKEKHKNRNCKKIHDMRGKRPFKIKNKQTDKTTQVKKKKGMNTENSKL